MSVDILLSEPLPGEVLGSSARREIVIISILVPLRTRARTTTGSGMATISHRTRLFGVSMTAETQHVLCVDAAWHGRTRMGQRTLWSRTQALSESDAD